MIKLKYIKLRANARISKAYLWDAGFDLYSCELNSIRIPPKQCFIFHTGIAINLENRYYGFIISRSGLATYGITVLNAPGLIDPGFRGEIGVILVNHAARAYTINPGDKIAQIIIQAAPNIELILANGSGGVIQGNKVRGTGAFGSSDKPRYYA